MAQGDSEEWSVTSAAKDLEMLTWRQMVGASEFCREEGWAEVVHLASWAGESGARI